MNLACYFSHKYKNHNHDHKNLYKKLSKFVQSTLYSAYIPTTKYFNDKENRNFQTRYELVKGHNY